MASRAVATRAITVKTNAIAMRVSAAPQARSIDPANGELALAKICAESAVFSPEKRLLLTTFAPPIVKIRGAVSPAARRLT